MFWSRHLVFLRSLNRPQKWVSAPKMKQQQQQGAPRTAQLGQCALPNAFPLFLKILPLTHLQGRNFKTSSTWKAQKLYFAMTLIILLLHYCDQPMWAYVCTCMLCMHMCANTCESLCIACIYMCMNTYVSCVHKCVYICEFCVPTIGACVCYVCECPAFNLTGLFYRGPREIFLESKHDDIKPNLVPYHYQPKSMPPILANIAIWHSSPVISSRHHCWLAEQLLDSGPGS